MFGWKQANWQACIRKCTGMTFDGLSTFAIDDCIESLQKRWRGKGLKSIPVIPVPGTYANPRTKEPVLPYAMEKAVNMARLEYDNATLFRLGGNNWPPEICDAVNKGWGNT